MADNRTFTLIGKFDDQITPQLKKLNRTFAAFEKVINRGMGRSFRELNKDLRSFAKDLDSIGDIFDRKAARGLNKFRDGIKAASEDARLLGKTLGDASQVGDNFGAGMKDGIRAAQSEAKVLGDILKANALIQVGQGVSNALGAGAASTLGVLQKGAGFFAKQFRAAVQDELEDMQARGSLYGSLKKQGVFVGKTEKEQTRDYRQTKRISRINEEVIGNIVRESPVSTATVSTLNRQLTDNLLPLMLKSRGITNLGTQSEAELEKTFGGKKGVGTELAKLYEQMAMLMPSPQYARMGAMGFTQAITSGTINRQLAIFEGNPVLVEALKTIDGGIQATSDIGKRVQIIKKALEVAAPTMMLEEMRMSVAGGLQAVQDTLTNPSVGILSMAMEVAGQGKKTMEDFGKINGKIVKGSAYEMRLADMRKKQIERMGPRESWNAAQKEKALLEEQAFIDKLDDILANANTPLERIAVSLAPVLQSVSGVLNAMGSIFMGPVNGAMKVLDTVFAKLSLTLDNLASDLRGKTRTVPEAFGRMVGEIFKAFANLFDPTTVGKEAGSAIDKMFADFKKGFDSVDGSKWMKMVVDGLNDIIMRLLFNEGDIMKGVTPLGEGLAKIFLLLSAPAFISALISGLVPVALFSMGGMIKAVFKGITKGAQFTTQKARGPVKNWWQTAYTKPIGPAQAGSYEAMRGPGFVASKLTGTAKIQGALSSLVKIGQKIPGLSLALAGLDFTLRKASGQKTSVAAGGAAGSLVGGIAGGALGSALGPAGTVAGAVGGSIIGSWIGENIVSVFNNLPKRLETGWSAAKSWFTTLPETLGGWLGATAVKIKNWFQNELPFIWMKFKSDMGKGITTFKDWVGKKLSDPATYTSLGQNLLNGLKTGLALINIGGLIVDFIRRGAEAAKTGATVEEATGSAKEGDRKFVPGVGSFTFRNGKWAKNAALGSLGDAISQELRMKPPGSSLVIANSSETIIPAAGGNGGGMVDFVRTMYSGFTSVVAALTRVQQAQEKNLGQINQTLIVNQQQTNTRLAKLETKFSVPGMGSVGGVDSFTSMASSYGLTMTSGHRPGDDGWHGVNRARDYSNGSGPTPQMLAFARFLVSNYGSNLKELIYTPLGFSIKNGQRVPPYARAGHYNHVHVAYALGAGMPAFFSTQRAAMDWERKATLGNVKVSSITSNSSEGMGGAVSVNAPITIYQQPGQNSEQLAALVAMELSNAINQARSSSMYV